MKKITTLLLAGIMAGSSVSAMAESFNDYDAQALKGYNRVGLSYINHSLYSNDDIFIDDIEDRDFDDALGLNGFGIYYTHGFHLTDRLPMFLEVGGGFNFVFRNKSDRSSGVKVSDLTSLITLEAPVNYIYRFNIGNDWTIAPFVGLNLKLHLMYQDKVKAKLGNTSETTNFDNFKDSESMYGLANHAYNRFQMGWQTGVGFQYKPLYVGISYGTDFLNFYNHDGIHVNDGTFKINLGYSF